MHMAAIGSSSAHENISHFLCNTGSVVIIHLVIAQMFSPRSKSAVYLKAEVTTNYLHHAYQEQGAR